jgi:hypothetical protein
VEAANALVVTVQIGLNVLGNDMSLGDTLEDDICSLWRDMLHRAPDVQVGLDVLDNNIEHLIVVHA